MSNGSMSMTHTKLGDVADVKISGVDKKTQPGEDTVRLCNYTDIYYNWAITKEMYGGLMVASAKASEINDYSVGKGMVVITKDSETREDIGHSAYVADDFCDVVLGYHCAFVKPHKGELDGSFLNGLLRSSYAAKYFANNAGGSGQRYYLNEDAIKGLPLFLPSFKEQCLIGKFLSSIDRKIALNRKKIEKLEALAKTIYDYWFVQFDFPDANGRPYKSSGGKMVYNPILKREIPAGWEVGNLYRIAEYENGLACQKFRPREGEAQLPVVKIREMHEGLSADSEFVSVNIPEKHKLHDGDLLFSWSASLEVMLWCGGDAGLNQHIFKVIPKDGFSTGYVLLQLSQSVVNFIKIAEARKTTMGHITSDHIEHSCVALPDTSVRKMFAAATDCIFARVIRLRQETRQLISRRDFLLPLLMNGQVEVGE